MKTIKLLMKKFSTIPLEFDNVLPELLYNKNKEEIEQTIIFHGNKQEHLSTYFQVNLDGECSDAQDCEIIIDGDLHRVKYIGNLMSKGRIIVNSDVDLHVGAQMSGGHIIVNGDAESYAGREMTGGLLEIKGNVKEFCGSSYMGEWRGMSGGKIIIHGNVGKQLADCMMNGEIYVKGNCDILAGIHMVGGYIQIDGDVTQWPGGQMKKGTIVIKGNVGKILQGFVKEEKIQNPEINGKYHIGSYIHYTGDVGAKGKGHLWIKEN
ncbi:formylmethanofuran dehydrogenase subunit C [Methanosphaera sp. WGK6]|uniref:formylmethanofuran dehydrogenase subunit C n=1 Tax=Methanosphaera sp. WGK6 TaxID=1561964 RepID=UPI00084CB403|nr:formylmethanofuran dehydrogenase subunit C [Methanosphaera sp. WGK6]OED30295.1 formylmethanofuran dehydrogenase [Methanosphaera sp. WGK6]